MKNHSAGILLYRKKAEAVEVMLVHPGGPYFKNKDEGAWTIPKGLIEEGETPLMAAAREFYEETGSHAEMERAIPLGVITQKGGKKVHGFAIEQDFDCSQTKCKEIEIEFPYKSGRKISFPEIDKAEWFSVDQAIKKINSAQISLILALKNHLTIQ